MTVEGGATYIVVSNALKERGLQFHVTTEIGNVTLGAMATAATKDSSFPGGYGQISSYVSAMRLVTPNGEHPQHQRARPPGRDADDALELRAAWASSMR